MICQNGFISRIQDGQARISIQPRTACRACAAGKGCGMGLFTGLFSRQGVGIEIPVQPSWKPGDTVAVQVESGELTRLAARAYGFPLVAFLVGAGAVAWLLPPGAGADLGGLAAGAAAMMACAWWLGRTGSPRIMIGRPADTLEGES